MSNRKPIKALCVLVLVAAVACASFAGNAYKTLGTVVVSVDTSMQEYGDLVRAGKISQATQDKVKSAYLKYYSAMGAARAALKAYQEQKATQATTQPALNEAFAAASALLELLKPFVGGTS